MGPDLGTTGVPGESRDRDRSEKEGPRNPRDLSEPRGKGSTDLPPWNRGRRKTGEEQRDWRHDEGESGAGRVERSRRGQSGGLQVENGERSPDPRPIYLANPSTPNLTWDSKYSSVTRLYRRTVDCVYP